MVEVRAGTLAVDILATERLTRLVVEDEIMEGFRYKVIGRFPESKLSYLVTCPYCVSVWAGLAVTVGKRSRIVRATTYALALSQTVIHLKERLDG